MPKAVYCFGFVSGGCVDDTAVAFQPYEDSKVNCSHRWDRGIFYFGHSFHEIQVPIIVESSNHCPNARVTDNKRSFVLLVAILLKYKHTAGV